MPNDMQDFLDNVAPTRGTNKEADAAGQTFRKGLQSIADTEQRGQDALHSMYSEITGHIPAAPPRNTQSSWSESAGHAPWRKS